MWSLTLQRVRHTGGPENFQSSVKKDFFNSICQYRKSGTLLDHFIRSGDQRRWHGNAERLGSLEIDDQLEPGGLLYR